MFEFPFAITTYDFVTFDLGKLANVIELLSKYEEIFDTPI
jgi:hypothetical protein